MKTIVQILLAVIITISATLLLDYLFCDKNFDLEKERVNQQIDSLNAEIKIREDSIRVIEQQIKQFKVEISLLDEKIKQKDQQITYYKGKGKFEYVHSPDSLHRELNIIIKQRLSEDSSSADHIPR